MLLDTTEIILYVGRVDELVFNFPLTIALTISPLFSISTKTKRLSSTARP
jgi:hypothetical protein